ncbi:helix-turn-helix transcriptional regulator [Peptococcaceae bacterium 1198_IL3148]
MDIAGKLKKIRNTLGLSTIEMAKILKVDQSTISRTENDNSTIKIDRIEGYCKAAGITIEEFFCGDNYLDTKFRPEINNLINEVSNLSQDEIIALTEFIKLITNNRD